MDKYTIKNYYKNQIVFKEDEISDTAYLIKSGKIDIYKTLENQQVLLATFGNGEIFGEMSLLNANKRTATARASEYSELVVLGKDQYLSMLRDCPKVISSIVSALIKRLSHATSKLPGIKSKDPFFSICNILDMLGQNIHQQTKKDFKSKHDAQDQPVELEYKEAINRINNIVSMPLIDIEFCLTKLDSAGLISISTQGRKKIIKIEKFEDFMDNAAKFYDEFEDVFSILQHHRDLVDINELASLLDTTPNLIYKRIGWEEVPDKFFFFSKDEILDWIKEQGTDFFSATKIGRKSIENIDCFGDLVFVDNESLQNALGEMDTVSIAKMVKDADDKIKEKVFSNLSSRMKTVVDQILSELEEVDPFELAKIEEAIVNKVKHLQQQAATL